MTRFTGTDSYIATDDLKLAVNAAISLQRPLLVEAEPGTPSAAWLNPEPESFWEQTHSIQIIRQMMGNRMYPLTLEGLDDCMRQLTRQRGARSRASAQAAG